jgi:hypothetical protein
MYDTKKESSWPSAAGRQDRGALARLCPEGSRQGPGGEGPPRVSSPAGPLKDGAPISAATETGAIDPSIQTIS